MTTNTAIFHKMINEYHAASFTSEYIFGFADRGNIWACYANAEILPYVLKLDKASSKNGGGYSVRFNPNKATKELLKSGKAFILCSEAEFNTVYGDSKYNRGECFEMLIAKHFGQEWQKDSVPFTDDGDITVDGIPYQLKYTKATFCTESSLRNLRASK